MSGNGAWNRVFEWGWLPLFLVVMTVALLTRPLMPVDETRYLGVAWEMWQSGSWVVPLLNGEPYSHKPPLLFWLIHAGWAVFGVNEITPRLVGPAFALGSLFLIRAVARRLFPTRPVIASLAPWILAGTIYWLGFATMTMFDQLVVFFVLLGIFGLLELGQGRRRGWLWLFLGTALGVLAKGPFALIYLVPLTVVAPWWAGVGVSWRWFFQAGAVGFLGSCVALGWALWAAQLGGPAYAEAILWGQMAGRAVDAFDHAQPIYYYVWVLPLLFLPWTLILPGVLRRVWKGRGSGQSVWPDPQFARLMLAWVLVPFGLLSLASGKLPHYLLPVIPALSLATAALLAGLVESPQALRSRAVAVFWCVMGLVLIVLPWSTSHGLTAMLPGGVSAVGVALLFGGAWLWVARRGPRQLVAVALATGVGMVLLHLALLPLRPAFDFKSFATRVGELQHGGHPIAFVGRYRDEYSFYGRLSQPVVELGGEAAAKEFCAASPDGIVVRRLRGAVPPEALVSTQFRSKHDVALPCSALASSNRAEAP
ncbi:glycosyltransferase family 39 protein [Guyparkeria sp. GHLCS8-2]|uniref:ArnT family glycosyltransferase n=1 Tax=Guyparkeria halopsychrophila TaxID=3139421 RepID=UPI0037C54789